MAARKLGREFVIMAKGIVRERSSKTLRGQRRYRTSGQRDADIKSICRPAVHYWRWVWWRWVAYEISVSWHKTISGKNKLLFRHQAAFETRNYLNDQRFVEIETPYLIKSTPEGARDFVVPSRMNQGQFLCTAPVPTNIQAALDGCRNGSIFSDSTLLQRWGPQSRQTAGIYTNRLQMAFVSRRCIRNIWRLDQAFIQ